MGPRLGVTMAMLTSIQAAPAPQLRLFTPDEGGDSPPSFLTRQQRDDVAREPRLLWTLRELYERWYLPGVLTVIGAEPPTLVCYDSALRYWEAITGNPSLLETTDDVCIDFVGLLPEWGYCRRGVPRGSQIRIGRLDHFPSYWPLGSVTCHKHVTKIATLLRRAGPRIDPREQTARILREVPFIPMVKAEFEPKEPFMLEQARAIAAAAKLMDRPELPEWMPRELWWQTRVSLFYYTGLRAGTVRELRWSHVRYEAGETWLDVPGAIVKTGKGIKMPLHPQLALLLSCVRGLRTPSADDLLLPAGCCSRHFLTLHSELQKRAGIPEAQRQSPHAWRRTHGEQMGLLGADRQLEVRRLALDHADGRTTDTNYPAAVVNQLRLRLPPLIG